MASTFNLLLTICLMLLATSEATSSSFNDEDSADSDMLQRFHQWRAEYGRDYSSGGGEEEYRFQVFKKNVEFIESFNRQGNHTYELGINGFTDMTTEEFMALNGLKPEGTIAGDNDDSRNDSSAFRYANVESVPRSFDWRLKGAVTPIKNQLRCGSCWAFSAIGALEGLHQIKTGKLISLSEQELVDCDDQDSGCAGGLMNRAFKFLIKQGGSTSEENYPYKGKDLTCKTKKMKKIAAKITGYENVPENNERALMKAVAHQPVSVAMAVGGDFVYYKKGIYSGTCGTDLNHGVVAVGYGVSKDGTEYWTVRNSWGEKWGERGYFRLKRNIANKKGLCGIAMLPSYPTVGK